MIASSTPRLAVVLALVAMVCGGVADLIYKRGARQGLSAHRFLMVQTWTFGPAVVLYGLVTRTLVFDPAALWGCLAGVFAFTGFYNFAGSLRAGLVSINAPIFRLSFVVTVVLAVVFLGERVTSWKVVGIACALLAVWLLARGVPATGTPRDGRAVVGSLMRVAIATPAIGVANFIYKIGLTAGATSSSLLTAQACVVGTLAVGLVLLVDGEVRVPSAWHHAGMAGIVLSLAFIFLTEALARGEASIVTPIAQMGFVVTAVLGVTLLGEPLGRRTVAGLLAAGGAIVLLAHG